MEENQLLLNFRLLRISGKQVADSTIWASARVEAIAISCILSVLLEKSKTGFSKGGAAGVDLLNNGEVGEVAVAAAGAVLHRVVVVTTMIAAEEAMMIVEVGVEVDMVAAAAATAVMTIAEAAAAVVVVTAVDMVVVAAAAVAVVTVAAVTIVHANAIMLGVDEASYGLVDLSRRCISHTVRFHWYKNCLASVLSSLEQQSRLPVNIPSLC